MGVGVEQTGEGGIATLEETRAGGCQISMCSPNAGISDPNVV